MRTPPTPAGFEVIPQTRSPLEQTSSPLLPIQAVTQQPVVPLPDLEGCRVLKGAGPHPHLPLEVCRTRQAAGC